MREDQSDRGLGWYLTHPAAVPPNSMPKQVAKVTKINNIFVHMALGEGQIPSSYSHDGDKPYSSKP